jgi:sulfur-carrier protein
MRFVYFARVREAIGMDGEERDLPDSVRTIQDCITWLETCDTRYAAAFAEPGRLRFALDQQMVAADTALAGHNELAIFPPVTGG